MAMDGNIPDDWRRLIAYRRDILVTLALDGPASGTEIHGRIESEGRTARAAVYPHLKALKADGYIDSDARDGRENEYYLTKEGGDLLSRSPVGVAFDG